MALVNAALVPPTAKAVLAKAVVVLGNAWEEGILVSDGVVLARSKVILVI